MSTHDSSLFVKEVARHILPFLLEEMTLTEKRELDNTASNPNETEKEVFKKTI